MCTNEIAKSDLVGKMRLATGYSTDVADFIKKNVGTPCRMLCAICRLNWNKTATKAVNLLFVGRNQFFICDECKDISELVTVQQIPFQK